MRPSGNAWNSTVPIRSILSSARHSTRKRRNRHYTVKILGRRVSQKTVPHWKHLFATRMSRVTSRGGHPLKKSSHLIPLLCRGWLDRLALQLHFPFEMCAARFGLMGSSPERPCDDVRGLDPPLCKLDDDAADFLDLSLIHISEPTRLGMISYAVF